MDEEVEAQTGEVSWPQFTQLVSTNAGLQLSSYAPA